MSYVSIRFDVTADAADAWSDALIDAGALSVDVADPLAGTPDETPVYAEPGEPAHLRWSIARLTALCPAGTDGAALVARCAAALGAEPPAHVQGAVADLDWVRATQAQFGPIRIAPGFWIVPTWSAPPEPGAVILALDPGLAFGTGSHPTTRLCLQWLAAHVTPGARVLDYGCGSGILAIAAAKLGARQVVGTDIDPQALAASGANARTNRVAATFVAPDSLAPGAFDLVVANILTNPLIVLAPALAHRVVPDGRIALAGLLDEQAAQVVAAYARWFNIARWRSADGWTLLAGERRRDPLS